MLDSLVGISWNTGPAWPTYDCNRLWENFACGLAQVIERPTIHLPFPPEDGVHCLYADNPADVVDKVVALLADPDRALAMAVAGHEWFLRHHSSEARARYLLDLIERELGVKNERPVAGAPVGG